MLLEASYVCYLYPPPLYGVIELLLVTVDWTKIGVAVLFS